MAYQTQFSNFVGYRGVVKLNNVILLATGGSVEFAVSPIEAQGTWGAGYWNAASRVAYSSDVAEVSGDMACEVTVGDVIKALYDFAYANRGSEAGTLIEILPTGKTGFRGVGWCTQFQLQGSEKANLTASLNYKSYLDGTKNKMVMSGEDGLPAGRPGRDGQPMVFDIGSDDSAAHASEVWEDAAGNSSWWMMGAAGNMGSGQNGLSFPYNGLFPYWGHNIYICTPKRTIHQVTVPDDGGWTLQHDIQDWSASYQSDVIFKKTCGMDDEQYKSDEGAPLQPDYMALGQMDGSANLTYVGLVNNFNPMKFHSARGMAVQFHSPAAPDTYHTVKVPAMICQSFPMQIGSGADFITAQFSYSAVGDGFNPPVGLKHNDDKMGA